jgi:translation initiation factor 3 subunit G
MSKAARYERYLSMLALHRCSALMRRRLYSTIGSKLHPSSALDLMADSTLHYSRPDWADDVSDTDADPNALPQPTTTVNKDGTKTTISYRIDDSGRKVKVTRKIRTTVHKEKVNPAVAERRSWAKFGLEKGKPKGPQPDTTSVGENIQFRPSRDWKSAQADEAKSGVPKGGAPDERSIKEQLKDKKVKCRICSGEHFTARCPYKDTMAPVDAEGAAIDPLAEDGGAVEKADGGLGSGGSSYVPPHLRKGGAGAGERMGGKYERDDLATLRVTNVSIWLFPPHFARLTTDNLPPVQVSEMAEEQDLREMFERFGRVTRVFLAKDRDSGRAKGFAFISFVDRADAARACEKMDGFGYRHLILRVEFAKRTS